MSSVERPLIVQGDFSLLLEVDSSVHEACRDEIARFTELIKAPEYLHTYRISPLSIWNAVASGLEPEEISATLQRWSRYPVPPHVLKEVSTLSRRFGRLVLQRGEGGLELHIADPETLELTCGRPEVKPWLGERLSPLVYEIPELHRGRLKQALIKVGFPAQDIAGYEEGEPLGFALRQTTASGLDFGLRPYQSRAIASFYGDGHNFGGAGVVVLPCGAGKTVVGMGVMARFCTSTLILSPSITGARQWIAELLDKTTLTPDDIGEYSGELKQLRPVTVVTYQVLTHRERKDGEFLNMSLFNRRRWGLVIYDEVHLLPAPIFQVTAELQARRRLGLTATLVREDNRQDDVFALIGPRAYDVSWKEMEQQGWIARAVCTEVRVPLAEKSRHEYAVAGERAVFRIACENPAKLAVVQHLVDRHLDAPTLIIGTYVEQLELYAEALNAPLLTGQTSARKREQLFRAFREGEIRVLVVSKVANFAVDLPDASVAIQISGSFGSRQEEAQRLGRLLRPKRGENQAHFYAVVSLDTVEQEFGLHRQLFLIEQGYQYRIEDLSFEPTAPQKRWLEEG